MKSPSPETLFMAVDRTSSELLWSVTQLAEQPVDAQLRRRTAEMLEVVISGLRLNHHKLIQTKKDTHP